MKKFIKITIVLVALTCGTLYAGAGHGHSHSQVEVSQASIKQGAIKELSNLIKNKKLNKSWTNKSVTQIKKKQFQHTTEWVVSFQNTEIKDTAKQTLYIFFSLSGKTTGANFTGK